MNDSSPWWLYVIGWIGIIGWVYLIIAVVLACISANCETNHLPGGC